MATLPANLRPNANLTNFAIAHAQKHDVQALLAPGIVPVTKQSDRYLIWDKGQLLRSSMQPRRPGTEAALAEASVSADSYYAVRRALKRKLTDEDIEDYPGGLAEAEMEIAHYLTEQAYLTVATEFVSAFLAAASWGTGVNGNANQTGAAAASTNQFVQWDRSGSTPIEDLTTGRRTVEASIGQKPTHLILGPKVSDDLTNHADVIDRIKYTQRGISDEDVLASLFKVGNVRSIRATQNTAVEGQSTSMSQIAGRTALLAYFSPGASKNAPAAAKIFAYDKYGMFPRSASGDRIPVPTIKKWWDNDRSCWFYEAELYFDMKVTAPDAAVFYDTAVQA